MTIKQLQANYLLNEDRILLRFNTAEQAEYRLWLTRRVALFILAASSQLRTKKLETQHPANTAKAIHQFEKDNASETLKNNNDGTQTYQAGIQFPLGFDPLLVMDVTCALMKNGEKISPQDSFDLTDCDDALSIDFILPGGANINLKLTGNMLNATLLLLEKLAQNAAWGVITIDSKSKESEEGKNFVDGLSSVSFH